MRRLPIVIANTASFAFSAGVLTLLLQQVIALFCLVTLTPLLISISPMWLARMGGGPPPLWWLVPTSVGGFVLVATLDSRRADDWSLRTALSPLPIVGLFSVVAYAYRLAGLLLFILTLVLYIRYVRGKGRMAPLAYSAVMLVVVSALPIDVTLRNESGPPRLVPAVSGLPSRATLDMLDKGDAIMVGGCASMYLEPSRMVVW
jgi:hypothetical protein